MVTLPIFDVISLFILIVTSFFSIYLWFFAKGKRFAHKVLSLLLLIIATESIKVLTSSFTLISFLSWLPQVFNTFPLLLGPGFYFYTCAVIGIKSNFQVKDCVHLTPFIIASIYSVLLFNYQSVDQHSLTSTSNNLWQQGFHVLYYLVFVTFGGYLLASFLVFRNQGVKLVQLFSNLDSYRLNWMRSILVAVTAIYIIRLGLFLIPSADRNFYMILFICLVLISLFLLIFNGLNQHSMFVDTNLIDLLTNNNADHTKRNSDSVIKFTNNQAQEIIDKFRSNKWYLDPELTLAEVADNMSLDPKLLSELINIELKQNFFELVNGHRCEYAANLLSSTKDNILNIMLASGFNSKTAFNRAFKRHFNLTPSQYRKNIGTNRM
ncbi:MAG: AraC family transcriptional regulator [Colwellia sp.]|nr:AraC family transcriptional regulator [Colwellia sp.]